MKMTLQKATLIWLLIGCTSESSQRYSDLSEQMSNLIRDTTAFKHENLTAVAELRDSLLSLQRKKIAILIQNIDQKHFEHGTNVDVVQELVGHDLQLLSRTGGERYGLISFIPSIPLPAVDGEPMAFRMGWYALFNINSKGQINSDFLITPTTEIDTWYSPPKRNADPFGVLNKTQAEPSSSDQTK